MSGPLTEEEWARVRADSQSNIERVLAEVGRPKILLPYQSRTLELLESGSKVLFVEKSRRIGLTWGLAAYAVLKAGRTKTGRGMDVMYISYAQEMTREFIDACSMWARAFNQASMASEEFLFADKDESGDRSIQAFRIRFASGFEIVALSSAPRTLRGKQGCVIIDEAAFVDSLPELLKAALAFLIWGGQVVVCSTHDGAENEFNKQVQEILGGRSDYDHIRIDLDDALKDGLYERICLVTGEEWSPEAEATWRQGIIKFYGDGADEELYCIPTMGSGAWLSGPLIEARSTETDAPVLRLDLPPDYLHLPPLRQAMLIAPFMADIEEAVDALPKDVFYGFGFDFARVADLSVGTLLSLEKRLERRARLTIEMRATPGDEQKAAVKRILDGVKSRLLAAAFDATGMGWTVAEDMGRLFGLREKADDPGRVHAIKFSQDWYRTEMPPLKTAFEDASISIAPDAEHLSDLRLVKVIRGIPRVPDLRSGEKGKRRHGDYAIALALAYFATRQPFTEVDYTPVATKASRWDTDPGERDTPFRLSSLRGQRGLF